MSDATALATPYRRWDPGDPIDALVIGSGIGGLTAAVILAREAGQRVVVLERHYTPGGYTHSFRRPGFEWDVGVHYLGAMGDTHSPVRTLFDYLSLGQLQWCRMGEVYERMTFPGMTFDYVAGRERLEQSLAQRFPHGREAIGRYFRMVDACVASTNLYFMEKGLPAPLAWLGAPLLRRRFLRYARHTTREILDALGITGDLAAVLTGQWGDYGLPPGQSSFGVHAVVTHHYQEGAYYPQGGAARFAETMIPSIRKAGGEVVTVATVSRILFRHGRAVGVQMEDGRELYAKRVISNAGVHNTFLQLVPDDCRGRWAEQVERLDRSLPFASLYVGLDASDAELGLANSNLCVFPGPDHDANVARFHADPDAPIPCVYCSFPSGKDPTFTERYPNRATVQVMCPVPYHWFQPWENARWRKRGDDYEAVKAALAERLQTILEQHVPQVRGHIEHAELSTPLSYRHFAGYDRGEPYGLAHTPRRFCERRLLRPRSPLRGLYLTGQDVSTCGVVGAMAGGFLCASAILGRNLFGRVIRAAR